jgi:hypothetical protein
VRGFHPADKQDYRTARHPRLYAGAGLFPPAKPPQTPKPCQYGHLSPLAAASIGEVTKIVRRLSIERVVTFHRAGRLFGAANQSRGDAGCTRAPAPPYLQSHASPPTKGIVITRSVKQKRTAPCPKQRHAQRGRAAAATAGSTAKSANDGK